MPQYRVAPVLPGIVESNIDPEYKGFSFLTSKDGISWHPLSPDPSSLAKEEWYNNMDVIDPNYINKKMGLPPSYFVIKLNESMEDWIREHFEIESYEGISSSDAIFEGTYKNDSDRDRSE